MPAQVFSRDSPRKFSRQPVSCQALGFARRLGAPVGPTNRSATQSGRPPDVRAATGVAPCDASGTQMPPPINAAPSPSERGANPKSMPTSANSYSLPRGAANGGETASSAARTGNEFRIGRENSSTAAGKLQGIDFDLAGNKFDLAGKESAQIPPGTG